MSYILVVLTHLFFFHKKKNWSRFKSCPSLSVEKFRAFDDCRGIQSFDLEKIKAVSSEAGAGGHLRLGDGGGQGGGFC